MRRAWLCLIVAACGHGNGNGDVPNDARTDAVADAVVDAMRDAPVPADAEASAVLALLAGSIGGQGNADGVGRAARFNNPHGVAVDAAGNVFVADSDNHVIRKIAPSGLVTTFAGMAGEAGDADGAGSAARFNNPEGVAVDGAGTIFVADTSNHVLRRITQAGVVSTFAGSSTQYGAVDGVGSAARLVFPIGVAFDRTGMLYFTDGTTIRKVTPAAEVTTIAGRPSDAVHFSQPMAIAADSVGNVFVADAIAETIRKIVPSGEVTTFAGLQGNWGTADGTGTNARFAYPDGLAIDGADNLYVGDGANSTVRKITPAAVVSTFAGAPLSMGADDGLTGARFWSPAGLAVDGTGNVLVADQPNQAIRKIAPGGRVVTIAGAAELRGSDDAPGAGARFNWPWSVALDAQGNAYVSDRGNHTIRKVTPDGIVSTLAGATGQGGSVDGAGSAARFAGPGAIASDGSSLFVADEVTVRKVSLDGVVTTFAGAAGKSGSVDGVGAAARFKSIASLAMSATGNLFVADDGNDTIRRITPAGEVATIAGSPGMSGIDDGIGAAARFIAMTCIAVDDNDNAYVSGYTNTIRRISSTGVVATIAGATDVRASDDGVGDAARFHLPFGLATDRAGNVYVADWGNAAIRKVTPAGVVTTLAGDAHVVGIQLGAPPRFGAPVSVAVRGDDLVVVDGGALLVLRGALRQPPSLQ